MYEDVLSRLSGLIRSGRGWVACCPAHDDKSPSLSLALGDQHQLLMFCHAGCPLESIVGRLRITIRDLFPPGEKFNYAQAHDIALGIIRRQRQRLERYREQIEDGECWAIIRNARGLAQRLGQDSDEGWALLMQAAALETDMLNADS